MVATGCSSSFDRIDARVQDLVEQRSSLLGPDAFPPNDTAAELAALDELPSSAAANQERPPTVNPSAADLVFNPVQDADDVLERLRRYEQPTESARQLDLETALGLATANSREFQFAEEEYVLGALRLLIERHRWGPRFFDEVSAEVAGSGDEGTFDTALRLINEFRVTQRLPYGGEISARALASATEDLHQRVAGEGVQTATIILDADIPLLRGAGQAAREDLIQAERNLIYAARDFEDFRRNFLFEIAQDFLDLVVEQSSVENARRQVEQLRDLENRARSLYESGRTERFEAALAEQATVSAIDDLNERLESYRLAVDRFKIRLNVPIDEVLVIVPSELDLPVPQTDMEVAVRAAMAYRLDLQTQRDLVDDADRRVEVARNNLLPDLDLTGSLAMPTDDGRDRAGLDFEPGDVNFTAGITFGLPLDREIERLSVRQAQIAFERERRDFDGLRDETAVAVRAAVRDIDRARFTLEIQERNIEIGEQRKASIEAAPDRATARDASEAADELRQAEDRRDQARRDLQVAILRYLLETGQLRVASDGQIRPLTGMTIVNEAPPATAPAP